LTSCSPTIITLSRPRFLSLPIAVPFVRETHCRRDHCQPLLTCTRRFSASSPPQMRCLTRIFHPNIDDTTGKICARCSFLLLFFVTPWLDPRLQLPRRLQVGSHPYYPCCSPCMWSCFKVSRQRGAILFCRCLTFVPDPNGHDPLPDCKHAAELLLSNPEEFKRRARRHMQEVPSALRLLSLSIST